jgi:hypothetical protein
MTQARTVPSLRARIAEAQSRTTYSIDQSWLTPRREVSYTERYRGTEYETPSTVRVTREPILSRGRSFVLLASAALCVIAAALVAVSS